MIGAYLETLSWDEAEPALKSGRIVVLPVGARLKEHGYHLPLNNDWLTAEYLTRRVLELCDVLAAPTLPYGYFPAFVEYPGSVSIGRATFRDVIVDVARSFARHGTTKIYALNNGISTNWSLGPAREILRAEGVTLEFTDLTRIIADVKASVRTQALGTHADELETSMMMYLAPTVVRLEKAVPEVPPAPQPGPFTRDPNQARGQFSPSGAYGDPTRATREKGRILVEAMVSALAAELAALAAPDFVPAPTDPRYLS